MDNLIKFLRPKAKNEAKRAASPEKPAEAQQPDLFGPGESGGGEESARRVVYGVRVREGFKGEILALQAELQYESQQLTGKMRKVTDGEIMELMLKALKAERRNGGAEGKAVALADEVREAIDEIARRLRKPAAEVLEELIVEKMIELGLLRQN
jgi:hypothetical protein